MLLTVGQSSSRLVRSCCLRLALPMELWSTYRQSLWTASLSNLLQQKPKVCVLSHYSLITLCNRAAFCAGNLASRMHAKAPTHCEYSVPAVGHLSDADFSHYAEVIPGLEPPRDPSPAQDGVSRDASSRSSDSDGRLPTNSSDTSESLDSRQDSNQHASTSGRDSNSSSTSASSSYGSSSNSGQADQAGERSDGNGVGKPGRPEKMKHAVSVAGNKMQEAMQEEGNNGGARWVQSVRDCLHYCLSVCRCQHTAGASYL